VSRETGPWGRLAPNLRADRRRPPLAALAAETDPERFVWRVLPHAARTFGLAISLLPARLARPTAAAYLWCRALDTVEDLAPDAAARVAGFAAVRAAAAGEGPPLSAPAGAVVQDARDRVHLLLLERCGLLRRFTETLSSGSRARLVALVESMSAGMEAAARTRAETGGVLPEGEDRSAYCRAVLAEPLAFAEAELRAAAGAPPMDAARRALVDRAGELTQLANVCRDVEKDLRRGAAYDRALAPWLAAGAAPAETVDEVRTRLMRRVAELGPAVEPYFGGLPLEGRPGARAAAAVMCAATADFFRRANAALTRPVLRTAALPSTGAARAAVVATLSAAAARRLFGRLATVFEPADGAARTPALAAGRRDLP